MSYYPGYRHKWDVDKQIKLTSEEKLDEIPLVDIEKYLRKKKLENIKRNEV